MKIEYDYDQNQHDPIEPDQGDSLSDKISQKAPWWLISFGMHTLLIIISLFIIAFFAEELKSDMIYHPLTGKNASEIKSLLTDFGIKSLNIKDSEHSIEKELKVMSDESKDDPIHEKDVKRFEEEQFVQSKTIRKLNDTKGTLKGISDIFDHRRGQFAKDGPPGGGPPPKSQEIVILALSWLARHQNDDGSWSIVGCTKNCGKHGRQGKCDPTEGDDEYDVGATGLALLAFLGAGHAPGSREVIDGINCGDVVRKGLQYLMGIQDPVSGRIGKESDHFMYNHVLAAYALTEGYDATGNTNVRNAAQRALDFVIKAQNLEKFEDDKSASYTVERGMKLAWRYTLRCGDNDSSITGWCAMLLKSAEYAKLAFPRDSYNGIKKWYDLATDEETGTVGYDRKWKQGYALGAVIKGLNGKDKFDILPSVTAIGVMSRLFIDKNNRDKAVVKGVAKIQEFMPS